jgi:hypothetical protein
MGVINSAIFFILERFPERREVIRRLFSASNSFQTLCEDFRQCHEAQQYWARSTETDAPARRREYRALQRELAGEIVRFLDEADLQQPPEERLHQP